MTINISVKIAQMVKRVVNILTKLSKNDVIDSKPNFLEIKYKSILINKSNNMMTVKKIKRRKKEIIRNPPSWRKYCKNTIFTMLISFIKDYNKY